MLAAGTFLYILGSPVFSFSGSHTYLAKFSFNEMAHPMPGHNIYAAPKHPVFSKTYYVIKV